MRDIIKPGLALFLLTAVMAAILAVAQEGAKGPTAENERKAKEAAMAEVLPFESGVEYGEEVLAESGASYQIAYGADGVLGAAVVAEAKGYGGTLRVMVGVDSHGIVRGVRILGHNETPGLGANATKPAFYGQFSDKEGLFDYEPVKREPQTDKEIKSITSSTITSRAVIKAVNEAYETAVRAMGREGAR